VVGVCALVGARIGFVLFNLDQFGWDIWKMIYILRAPGLEFMGMLLGGILGVWFFAKRFKFEFWKVLDYQAAALAGAMVVGLVGCQLSGCVVGSPTNLFFGVELVGQIGRRVPVSLFESLGFLILFIRLWRWSLKYHFPGKLFFSFLGLAGGIRLMAGFFTQGNQYGWFLDSQYFGLAITVVGLVGLYIKSGRQIKQDLVSFFGTLTSIKRIRKQIGKLKKGFTNWLISQKINISKLTKRVKKSPSKLKSRLRLKSNPDTF
jgi:phosphatidylglycerol:prolipoprotein diacylglycerol transferase